MPPIATLAVEDRLEELERENARLRAENAALKKRLADLEALVRDLRARLKVNSTNSSMPPSSDLPGVVKPRKAPTGRRPGGQPGHPGTTRRRYEPHEVDHLVPLVPARCRKCKHLFRRGDMVGEPIPHQVVEAPPITVEVWEYLLHQALCPDCGEVTQDIYPLAAASAFYYQGVVVFDDIGDGELQPICAGWPRGQAEHIAYSLAGALPVAAVDALEAPSAIKVRILRELAEAIWITNIGQYLDLEVLGPVEYPETQAIEIAQCKTGRGIAKLSRMAGHFLDLDPGAIDAWERATIACATARQVASDVCDIWHKDPSPDLVTGKCTLPVAYALRQLTGADLEAFRDLRRRCRYERGQHDVLRFKLERLGTLQYVQSRLVSWRSAGTQALQEAGVSPAAQEWLSTWISQADIFADIC